MIVRTNTSGSIRSFNETLLPGSSSSSQNQLVHKVYKVVIFDADSAAEDLDFTLEQLARLKQAGYHVFATTPAIPAQQSESADKSQKIEITDVTDLPDENFPPALYDIHRAIRAHGVPVLTYNDNEPHNGIEDHFYRVFGALALNVRWIAVEGLWICKQERFGSKFKKHLHVLKFDTLLTDSNMMGDTLGNSVSGSSSSKGDATLALDKKGEIIIGQNKFSVHLKYAAEHYPTLSGAFNKIGNSFFNRAASFFTSSKPATQTGSQQLLLPPGENESDEEQENVSQPVEKKSRKIPTLIFLFLILATVAITAAASFVFLPTIVAVCITTIVTISAMFGAKAFDNHYNKSSVTNAKKLVDAPIVEEPDDELDNDSNKPDRNAEILQRLKRARHGAEDSEVKIDSSTFVDPSQDGLGIEIEEALDHTEEFRAGNGYKRM